MPNALETLAAQVATLGDTGGRTTALLNGLADLVKATSNDQNVQKLSRDLRAAAPALVTVLTSPHATKEAART